MISVDILSKIWKGHWKFELIEEIDFENTFVQQTSGNRNLWKVQIGQTENYIVFFKQEVTLNEKPTDRFLLHMSPKHSLRVRRHPGRRLEVTLPNGCPVHFKLPFGRGCGTSWVKWRSLEKTCSGSDQKLLHKRPLFAVFDLRDLRHDLGQALKEKGFTTPLFLVKEPRRFDVGWMLGGDGKIRLDSSPGGEVTPKKASHHVIHHQPSIVRKTRVIQRFGEGIPEGCTFKLSLTNDYLSKDDPDLSQADRQVLSKIKRTRTNPNIFQYMCEEMLASDAAYRSEMVELIMSHSHASVVVPETSSRGCERKSRSPQKPQDTNNRRDFGNLSKRHGKSSATERSNGETGLMRPFHYLLEPLTLSSGAMSTNSKGFGRSLSSNSTAGGSKEKNVPMSSLSESDLNVRKEELPPSLKKVRVDLVPQNEPRVVKKSKWRFPKFRLFK